MSHNPFVGVVAEDGFDCDSHSILALLISSLGDFALAEAFLVPLTKSSGEVTLHTE